MSRRYAPGSIGGSSCTCVCSCRPTEKELQVTALAATGLTNKQISERLRISERTVENGVRAARDKLGARDRAHLVTLAFKRRLIEFGPDGDVVAAEPVAA